MIICCICKKEIEHTDEEIIDVFDDHCTCVCHDCERRLIPVPPQTLHRFMKQIKDIIPDPEKLKKHLK